jgi:hypothetical protein
MMAAGKPIAAKRLTIGKGFNRRLTKAGKAAEAHFDAIVAEYMASIGAKPSLKRTWQVETTAGTLHVSTYGSWIATLFEDVEKARLLGLVRGAFYNGKWNHHYGTGAAEAELGEFQCQLARILAK